MNISNLTKGASAFLLVVVLGIVGYYGYHYRRDNKAKEAWHKLEKSLGENADKETKIKAYKDFIAKWGGTRSYSTACYGVGLLEMNEKNYENAIKYFEMASFAKGGILETERHYCLGQCYEGTNKPKKALIMYDHMIKYAPAYSFRIKALWAASVIYGQEGPLQNQTKQKNFLEQIIQIPEESLNDDEGSKTIINAAQAELTVLRNAEKQAA